MNTLTGYVEITLPDGGKVELKYGLWAVRELCKRWNTTVAGLSEVMKKGLEEDPLTTAFDIIMVGAIYCAKLKKQPCDFTDVDVSSWIDDTGGMNSATSIFALAMTAFNDSMGADSAPETDPNVQPTPAA